MRISLMQDWGLLLTEFRWRWVNRAGLRKHEFGGTSWLPFKLDQKGVH